MIQTGIQKQKEKPKREKIPSKALVERLQKPMFKLRKKSKNTTYQTQSQYFLFYLKRKY